MNWYVFTFSLLLLCDVSRLYDGLIYTSLSCFFRLLLRRRNNNLFLSLSAILYTFNVVREGDFDLVFIFAFVGLLIRFWHF